MLNNLTRRGWLQGIGASCAAMVANSAAGQSDAPATKVQEPATNDAQQPITATAPQPTGRSPSEPFGYCLNTSTIRGQKLPLVAELEIAAKVGYQAVEPWISEVEQYQKDG